MRSFHAAGSSAAAAVVAVDEVRARSESPRPEDLRMRPSTLGSVESGVLRSTLLAPFASVPASSLLVSPKRPESLLLSVVDLEKPALAPLAAVATGAANGDSIDPVGSRPSRLNAAG